MFNMSYQISQNVLLLQETQAATADNLGDRAPGTRGGSAEDITARKATPYTHTRTHTHTNTHRVWWQTTVTLSSSIAGRSCWTSDTSHTAQRALAPLVSHCRHRGTARELLQLCRTNTEISLSKKHALRSKKCLNISQRHGL